MFIAMAEDLRVIFIKLADRLHNMKTLKHHPKKDKRERIALDTINIYAPIADRLGLYHLKNDLDEECFKIIEPERYKKLKKELKELEPEIKNFTTNAKKEIEKLVDGIDMIYVHEMQCIDAVDSGQVKMVRQWLLERNAAPIERLNE